MTLNPHDELLDRARQVIRDLREKLTRAESRRQPEPIAVIGIGIRFPGSGSDPEQFWRMIVEGRDAVRTVPSDRWDGDALYSPKAAVAGKINTRRGAFLDDVRRFDAAFFDITPREAERMDPQQRIFLETAWHALEDAGLPKAQISGSDAGVFVGVHSHSADYQTMQFEHPETFDAYAASGTAHDMIGGRLAYWLDLHGPAVAVNTACSSSLTAVHFACRSLRTRDCSVAIAGGVNLLLRPESSVAAAQLQLLSGDGRCKSFDARADGMGRGEGCGVIVLKMLDAAQRDGDRVLAIIRGSAVNQDGKTNGLTAPNGLAQQRVLRRALEDAKVEPWQIGYIEAHGTGTALGDPIEVEALAEVLGGTQRTAPCSLGAVKANIGHLEGAAGIAGLIKTVLVLRHRWIPPVANLEKLNPHLAVEGTGLSIPQRGREWKDASRRLAGVSSFGWSGTNVHVVLEEASAAPFSSVERSMRPVLVSAQSSEALRILAAAYADRIEHADEAELADICYTSALGRTPHSYRIAVAGTHAKEMASQLRQRAANSKNGNALEEGGRSGSDDLHQLMHAWEAGAEVDWQTAFPNRGTIVDLPRYPFQGRSYWLDTASVSTVARVDSSLPDDWIYSTQWIQKTLDVSEAKSQTQPMTWLLFDFGGEFGRRLASAARSRGDRAIEVRPGEHFSQNTADEVVIGTDITEGLKQLLDGLTRDGVTLRVLHVVGTQDAPEVIAEVLEVTQSIIQSGISTKLWFVTQGAETPEGAANLQHPAQMAVRGFSRVFGVEHPELAGGVIDIDSTSSASASAICDEVAQGAEEDRVALRQSDRWVARLRRDGLGAKSERPAIKADRCYLVTGAFGRLGVEIASWLVDHGARHLALAGRRDPSQSSNPDLVGRLAQWRAQGVTVIAEACDVSNESQVRALLAKIHGSGSALAGVVHAAAGVLFTPIVNTSPQDIELAFRAKVEGARVLDRCLREEQLDFFVLFGSAAATIGLRNGALYAAANSCLDAVVHERQTLRLPVLNVEWGSWQHSEDKAQQELIERSGFAGMRPAVALRALGALIAEGRTSALVAKVDWSVLGPALDMRGRAALVAQVIGLQEPAVGTTPVQEDTEWLCPLGGLPPHDRRHHLLDCVGAETRRVFGMAPEDPLDESRGLFQLGMDSLMSVKLKRRLEARTGLKLPGTLTLTYPTIAALAKYLEGKLFPSVDAPSTSVSPLLQGGQEENFSASVVEMNDAETNAAIAAELAAIQQKLGVL